MFLNQYSRKGCEIECAARKAISICKCLPWYYPNDYDKWPMCDMFGAYCFELIMGDDAYYKKCSGQCIADCKETEFILFSSRTPLDLNTVCGFGNFHQKHFQDNFKKHFAFLNYRTLIENGSIPDLATSLANDSLCKSYVQNYVAFVSVQGGMTRIILTHRERRIFFYDQLGIIGGTMGLFVGMSFMSMFETGFLVFSSIMLIGDFWTFVWTFAPNIIQNIIQKKNLEDDSHGQSNMDEMEQEIYVSYLIGKYIIQSAS